MSTKRASSRRVGPALALLVAACSESPADVGSTSLLTVAPSPGAVSVEIDARIEVRFDGRIAVFGGPIALQMGDCPGPVVAGTWSRTADGMGLGFTPDRPLDPSTRYTVHVGGGMTDAEGATVDLERHGLGLGGTWVTLEMVMGMPSMGMGMGPLHSGPEWRYPNGMYGLAFAFTTGP